MTAETIGVFMACGIFMMLVMLRLEASRFGAAEYDEPGRSKSGFWTRASWYVIGALLIAALYVFHPAPDDVLFLRVGAPAGGRWCSGWRLAAIGLAQAGLFARLRYGYLRLPPGRAYPGAALNAVGTAVIDEATFRGAVLGVLLAVGVPDGASIVMAAIVYVLATRLAAPGHHPYMALLAGGHRPGMRLGHRRDRRAGSGDHGARGDVVCVLRVHGARRRGSAGRHGARGTGREAHGSGRVVGCSASADRGPGREAARPGCAGAVRIPREVRGTRPAGRGSARGFGRRVRAWARAPSPPPGSSAWPRRWVCRAG